MKEDFSTKSTALDSSSLESLKIQKLRDGQDLQPISPKEASTCLKGVVEVNGFNNSMASGECPVTDCRFVNPKNGVVSGFCLKQVAGVNKPVDVDLRNI